MHTRTKKRPTKSDIESVNKVISEVIHGFSELTMPSAKRKSVWFLMNARNLTAKIENERKYEGQAGEN